MDYNLKNLKFEKNYLDIGTGDGRYVFKSALKNPNYLYIGIDPAPNLKDYQRKINRKKLNNSILIVSSIENFNPQLSDYFDEISIILPWGSLLKYVVTTDQKFFEKIITWLKPLGNIKIIFGFNEDFEEKETKRLGLPELNTEEIQYISQKYKNLKNVKLVDFRETTPKDLKNFETTWAKKLTFGAERKYIYIELKRV
jgi:16S rRNA (adenine(1408)-N(1))-methyltransferase